MYILYNVHCKLRIYCIYLRIKYIPILFSADGLVGDTALLEIKIKCPLSTKDTIDIQVAVDNKKVQ